MLYVCDFRTYDVHGNLQILHQSSQSGTCEVESLESLSCLSVIPTGSLCKESNKDKKWAMEWNFEELISKLRTCHCVSLLIRSTDDQQPTFSKSLFWCHCNHIQYLAVRLLRSTFHRVPLCLYSLLAEPFSNLIVVSWFALQAACK